MLVRDATADDAEAIARVITRSWQVTYRGIHPDEFLDALDADEAGARWRRSFTDGGVPPFLLVAEVDGKPIGAVFCLLDYNTRIKAINGRLFPFGFLKLLWNKRAIKRMRAISTNVIPEYQAWGVGLVLLAALVPRVREWGIEETEFSWVLESNYLSRKTLERGGAVVTKTYRMYDDVGR